MKKTLLKLFFVLFVLIILTSCIEQKVFEEKKQKESGEKKEQTNTGIDDSFEEPKNIQPPSPPSQ